MIPCDTCKNQNFHFDKSAGRVCVQENVVIVVEKVRKSCPMWEGVEHIGTLADKEWFR